MDRARQCHQPAGLHGVDHRHTRRRAAGLVAPVVVRTRQEAFAKQGLGESGFGESDSVSWDLVDVPIRTLHVTRPAFTQIARQRRQEPVSPSPRRTSNLQALPAIRPSRLSRLSWLSRLSRPSSPPPWLPGLPGPEITASDRRLAPAPDDRSAALPPHQHRPHESAGTSRRAWSGRSLLLHPQLRVP